MKPAILLASVAALAAMAFAHFAKPDLRLTFNPSASAPRGWYVLRSVGEPHIGMRVLAWPPPWAGKLADGRGYVPRTVPLLKPVAATGGAQVCRRGAAVSIDRRLVAIALREDRAGRPLPVWQGCRHLGRDDLFLLAVDRPDSFDGRYFGPVRRASLIAQARPVWTW